MVKKKESSYTGVAVLEFPRAFIDEAISKGKVDIPDKRLIFYPNQFIYLKSNDSDEKKGVICQVNPTIDAFQVIKAGTAFGISPKNKEQTMAMSALMNPAIPLCTLTGRAGTGKTLITIAAALEQVEKKKYDRIIITRPMSQVGKYDLGALPGDVNEKFGPYLENYISNIQQLGGKTSKHSTEDIIKMYKMEAMPMQLIRGASWINTFIIADECQILDKHEMLTLGTRIGQNSKLVIMGDLNQRDEPIAREETGLHIITNSQRMKMSPLTSHIELIKSERSELAALFADTFEDL